MSFAATLPCYLRPRREKMFGIGRPRPMDRNAKVRIMHLARCLSHRTEKGKAYGDITAKALAVLEALLWGFHNAKSGLCFPSYEKIAEAAGSARSTVAEAIKALEDAGILSWVNRLKRVFESGCAGDLFGHRIRKTRVIRTSNGYHFIDPQPSKRPESFANSSKSDFPCHSAFRTRERGAPTRLRTRLTFQRRTLKTSQRVAPSGSQTPGLTTGATPPAVHPRGPTGTPRATLRQPRGGRVATRGSPLWTPGMNRSR